MQGQGDNKHSIDSDDEEDDRQKFADFDKMAEDDMLMEGQEDDTVAQDGEIKITPFNLKEEQQEGSFSKDGNFVWNKKDEVKDAWLDDVDMQKVSIGFGNGIIPCPIYCHKRHLLIISIMLSPRRRETSSPPRLGRKPQRRRRQKRRPRRQRTRLKYIF